jgi:hypothetical protein
MSTIIERFLKSPEGKKIAADLDREGQEERVRLAARKAAAIDAWEKAAPSARARHERAERAVVKAREALRLAEAERSSAYAELAALAHARDAVVNQCDSALVKTADPAIDAAIAKWWGLEERGRHELRPEVEYEGLNLYGKPVNPKKSTGPAIVAYLQGLRDAIAAAELLKLEPLGPGEVAERLASLELGLPNPQKMIELV